MDCSGERFVPRQADPFDEISVEHLQRYHAVKDLVRGKTVLDAGAGEGYGAHLLAETASHVAGVDISPEAIENARANYQRENLEYRVGSVDALPFEPGSFDVVVSFEVIEHLDAELQTAFLREARRVLKAEGVLIISTPNKAVYSDNAHYHNEFHKREFYIDEFESFLGQSFPRISLFGQSWFVTSVLDKASSRQLTNLRPADRIAFAPKYVVAVCGTTEAVDTADLSSAVIDRQGKLEGMWQRILALQAEVDEKNSWALSLQDEVEIKNSWALSLDKEILSIRQTVAHYKQEAEDLEARLTKAHQHIASLDEHAAFLGNHIRNQNETISGLEKHVADLNSRVEFLSNSLRNREAELDSIKQSDFWKIATRYWRLRDAALPRGSRRRRFLKSTFRFSKTAVRGLGRIVRGKSPWPAGERKIAPEGESGVIVDGPGGAEAPIAFASAEQPKVSIIVPAFNQWAHTYRCMKSIQQTTAGVAYEVILADDGSTDGTVRAGEILIGVTVLRDGQNRGFLRNCNLAAGQARAAYLYFLNNDAELRPGAIQALASLLDRDPAIGMAGSKSVYPDGRLQEAGGIVWADGSGWNFGRGQDPDMPAYNYVKEVDYVSGASIMIRSDLWKDIGGFDDRFAPAYCEDSDLAFEVRKRGFKVVYQPQSVIVHFEGVSHGTDVSQNAKAHQVKNTETLKSKWVEVLPSQLPHGIDVFHARDRSAGRKAILIIDHYVPQFDKDAGSRTLWSFIQALLEMRMNVKLLGDNFCAHQPYTDLLQQAGVEVLVGAWAADHWPEWLAESGRHIDYVLLSRPHIAPKYLRAIRRHTRARVFYYVHDLHYLRELKWAELQGDTSLRARADRSKAKERHLMSQMDVILSCSDTEAALIRELCPGQDVIYVPPYSVDVDVAGGFNADERAGLLFVGGFSHPPNTDGVLWFVREVWPAAKARLPGLFLNIAGSSPPQEVTALASEDVRVLGFVSDDRLIELYRTSRLVVIPLRYGAGVKGKTVEAMAYGVPVVCTEWGVEGMPGVAEILDPMQHRSSLAEAIAALYNDIPRLEEISRKERAYVAQHFTIEKIQMAFTRAMVPRE